MGNYRTTLPLFYYILSLDQEYQPNQECTFTRDQLIKILLDNDMLQINTDRQPPEKSLNNLNLTEAHQNNNQKPTQQTKIKPAPFKIAVPALRNILIKTAKDLTDLTKEQIKSFLDLFITYEQSHAYLLLLIYLVGQINKQKTQFLSKYKENLQSEIQKFSTDTPKHVLMRQAFECFTISSKIDLEKIWMVGKMNEIQQQLSQQQTQCTNQSIASNTRGRRRASQNQTQTPQKINKVKKILKSRSRRTDALKKYKKNYKRIKRQVSIWVSSKKGKFTKI